MWLGEKGNERINLMWGPLTWREGGGSKVAVGEGVHFFSNVGSSKMGWNPQTQ
jgi:hypothetical protein